jgi:nucleotide-binding universal stress UspA family protein
MSAITRILCPVDFSECSRHALEQAAALARECRAPVIALHAFAVAPVTERDVIRRARERAAGAPIVLEPAHGSSEKGDAVRTELRQFVDSVGTGGAVVQLDIAEGDPIDAIVRASEALRADLIVMGTHGRSGMNRLILGSVAEAVLRQAACPVLTVPRRADPTASLAFARILCAVDFSSASLRALQYAAELAPAVGAELCALHVVELITGDGDGLRDEIADAATDYRQAFREAALERLETMVPAALGDDRNVRHMVTIGRPHREIVRIAEDERFDLIVMGVEARSAADLLLFGSTTQHVLRRSPCPVLTVRH